MRASLVAKAECWDWSSAATHCGAGVTETWLAMNLWSRRWSATSWRAYLEEGISDSNLGAIRRSTYSGRPLGSAEFTRMPQKRGPKKKTDTCDRQETFSFDA